MDKSQGSADANSSGNHSYLAAKNYQDKDESHDSRLKAIWDKHMGDVKEKVVSYSKACVLLLSWDEKDDDLHTHDEVTALASVFKDTFNYQIVRKVLMKDMRRKAQVQVNRHLAEFVDNYDDTNTLLIVYYAGHGKRVEPNGSMVLEASRSFLPDESSNLHEVVWNSAEHNIKETKSDVLVIFDCCQAGALDQNVRSANFRAFEFLAATSANSTTRKPGPHSFTTALIWALKCLGKTGKRFPTQELVSKIMEAPDFPGNQGPRIGERGIACVRRIVLAPLRAEDTNKAREKSLDGNDIGEELREDLSVRFVFNKEITTTLVKDLSLGLRRLITEGDFDATTVLWEGINSSRPLHAKSLTIHQVAQKFLATLNRRKSGSIVPSIQDVPRLQPPGSPSSEDNLFETPDPEVYDESGGPGPQEEGMVGRFLDAETTSPIDMKVQDNLPQRNYKRKRANDASTGNCEAMDSMTTPSRPLKRPKTRSQKNTPQR